LTLVSEVAAGPLVKAADTGEALDGTFKKPGTGFDFYFIIA
jgi:hypothetical protein